VQALVSKMFSFAVDADLLPANPCLRVRKRASEQARRRVLSDAEIALFWHRITKRPVSRRIGLALRLTGAIEEWPRSCGAAFLDGAGDRE
jgi:hypothetical protein